MTYAYGVLDTTLQRKYFNTNDILTIILHNRVARS
jgi:hypothetical protein